MPGRVAGREAIPVSGRPVEGFRPPLGGFTAGRLVEGAFGRETAGGFAGRLTAGWLMEGRLGADGAAGRAFPSLGALGRAAGALGREAGLADGLSPPRFGAPFKPAPTAGVDNNKAAATQAMVLIFECRVGIIWSLS
jgi:hypothetical protein